MRVYVAGPYTQGDVAQNVRRAIEVGNNLLEAGHTPFIPHLTHFWHLLYPQDSMTWITWCLAWLEQCEALIRLPGASHGADTEVSRARQLGIPVFTSVRGFLRWIYDGKPTSKPGILTKEEGEQHV